jgi:hypothetical protein
LYVTVESAESPACHRFNCHGKNAEAAELAESSKRKLCDLGALGVVYVTVESEESFETLVHRTGVSPACH